MSTHSPAALIAVPAGHRHPVTHSSVHRNAGPSTLSQVVGHELAHELHDPPEPAHACTTWARLGGITPAELAAAELTAAAAMMTIRAEEAAARMVRERERAASSLPQKHPNTPI